MFMLFHFIISKWWENIEIVLSILMYIMADESILQHVSKRITVVILKWHKNQMIIIKISEIYNRFFESMCAANRFRFGVPLIKWTINDQICADSIQNRWHMPSVSDKRINGKRLEKKIFLKNLQTQRQIKFFPFIFSLFDQVKKMSTTDFSVTSSDGSGKT